MGDAPVTPGRKMAINYLILLSRQGKVRLAKWFTTLSPKEKAKIIKDVTQLVLSRRTRMCNFLEYKDTKVVYRRYASLFFIAGCASTDNELISLEIVHRYVEQMDKYYGNVCELDIIFNFQKAYFILDELLLAGELQESSKKNVLRCISQEDSLEDIEVSCFTCVHIFLSCTCAPPLDFSRPDVSGWRFHAIGLAHHLRRRRSHQAHVDHDVARLVHGHRYRFEPKPSSSDDFGMLESSLSTVSCNEVIQ